MLDETTLLPGFPEWTDLQQETGLDPLGMQRPIELVYQALLPGISTITLRLRYYSFFAWLLEAYARSSQTTNNVDDFRFFQRRAEALLALVCARNGKELGVTGIDWANKQLALHSKNALESIIDFSVGADQNSELTLRYLRNKGGAFGAIYASQMREMGLVKLDDPDLRVPFCQEAALPLAKAFEEALGNGANVFLEAVASGRVSLGTLDQLQGMIPSNIVAGSAEQTELAKVLLAKHPSARDSDRTRSETLKMLLRLAETHGRPLKSEETKWEWFGADRAHEHDASSEVFLPTWALYQASDLLRLAYETILAAGLYSIKQAPPGTMGLERVISETVHWAEVPSDPSFTEWLRSEVNIYNVEHQTMQITQAMLRASAEGEHSEAVKSACTLIGCLLIKASSFDREVLNWLGSAEHFQSLSREMKFMDARADLPVNVAFAELFMERVFRRHLWVASRKFRNQKAYTFLFEPDEGALRFREGFKISPSSPRIDQAVQFLRDLKFLDDDGITDLGARELVQP